MGSGKWSYTFLPSPIIPYTTSGFAYIHWFECDRAVSSTRVRLCINWEGIDKTLAHSLLREHNHASFSYPLPRVRPDYNMHSHMQSKSHTMISNPYITPQSHTAIHASTICHASQKMTKNHAVDTTTYLSYSRPPTSRRLPFPPAYFLSHLGNRKIVTKSASDPYSSPAPSPY